MADRRDLVTANFSFTVSASWEQDIRNVISDFEDFLTKIEDNGVMVKSSRHDFSNLRPYEELYKVEDDPKT
jgi:hypothetical protein